MCGICGFAGFADRTLLELMTSMLKHRGPDDKGIYIDKDVGLGHRRLSIIDTSPLARQPMTNEDGSVVGVFNGEIYNFKDIRHNLEKKGHRFISQSDSEVIIHSYEEYGEDCTKIFNGMFAIAVWDKFNRKLFLARDRLGIKPLYYTCENNRLLFASEIKPILENKSIARMIDFESLDRYLTLRYVPGDKTLFKNIYKLPPASNMTYKDGNLKINSYWQLQIYENSNKIDESEYVERFGELLKDAVKLRLMSDVPFGAFVSGGVDSGTIVALMAKFAPRKIKTFTVGFNTDIDEFVAAREISRYFDTDHTEITVGRQSYDFLSEIACHMSEPIGDSIVIPIYLLSKEASKTVKMVLTGEGADEIFGSYIHQTTMHFGEIYSRFLSDRTKVFFKKVIKFLPISFLDKFFSYPASLGKEGKARILKYLDCSSKIDEYYCLASVFAEEDKNQLYSDYFKDSLSKIEPHTDEFNSILSKNTKHMLNKIIELDIKYWLPNYTLRKLDTLTMASSLEARVPFLDHRLVEFCANIPTRLKIKGFTTKYLLRKAMETKLPTNIVRRGKKPFYFPHEKCFGGGFNGYAKDLLNRKTIYKRGLFKYSYIEKLLNSNQSSELIKNKQIMSLLILENWMRIYTD